MGSLLLTFSKTEAQPGLVYEIKNRIDQMHRLWSEEDIFYVLDEEDFDGEQYNRISISGTREQLKEEIEKLEL